MSKQDPRKSESRASRELKLLEAWNLEKHQRSSQKSLTSKLANQFSDVDRYPDNSGLTSLKSLKRSHSTAFANRISIFPSKHQKFLSEASEKQSKANIPSFSKSDPTPLSYYSKSLTTSSANINENNDKFTNFSTRNCCSSITKVQEPIKPNHLISYATTSQLSTATKVGVPPKVKEELFPTDSDSYVVLDKLTQRATNSNNKRRYCHNSKSDNLIAIDKEVLKRFLLLEEEFREEILSSPPPQIPRLFRRSQSAFGQAREAAETKKLISKANPPSYRRYNSWSNGTAFQFSDTNSPRVSSGPADLCFTSARPSAFELNSNANATPHNKFVSKQNFFTSQLLAGPSTYSDYSTTFPKATSSTRSELFEPGYALESVSSQFGSPKTLGHFKLSSPQASVDRFPADKDIENLARLKVDITKSALACTSCKKKSGTQSNVKKSGSILTTAGEKGFQNVLQRQLKSNHCLQSREEQRFKELSSLPPIVANKINKKEDSKVKNSLTEYPKNLSLFKKEVPEVLALIFAEKNTKSGKAFGNSNETGTAKHTKPIFGSFANFLSHSRNKHSLHSSSNNHNIRKEIRLRSDENHNRKADCGSLKFVQESNQPFHFCGDFDQHPQLLSCSSTSPTDSPSVCYVQSDMGCIHSVSQKKRVEPCRSSIYSDVRATIDQSPTIIEEYSPIVLRYRTPYFRAHAQVIMPPIRNKETWTVGWIQACDYMKFINQYGDLGYSSWEIPALKANRVPAVSDSDGVSYPWYGNTTEIATIVGPTDSYTRMNLTMNDNFYPSVTWDIPVSEGTNAHLTEIIRDQSFITWLAAINETTKEIIVLKTVKWSFYLEIHIDPSRKLGQRARVVTPPIQNQPTISNGPCEKHHVDSATKIRRRVTNNSNSNCLNHIPITALVRPSANNAQTLIWRPSNSEPIVVVPPKEEHRDSNELVLFNGCSAMHGKEAIMREISRQELIQLQQLTR